MALKIGIIGHRELSDPFKLKSDLKETIDTLLMKHREEAFDAYTSLAMGADLIFAQLATDEYKAKLYIILPFSTEDYIKTIPIDYQRCFLDQFSRATDVTVVCPSIYVSDKVVRKNAYYKSGTILVQKCDVIIAAWDYKPAIEIGGTSEIVQYAKSINKKLVIIKTLRH